MQAIEMRRAVTRIFLAGVHSAKFQTILIQHIRDTLYTHFLPTV